jgi:hypothetical protein
LGVISFSQLVKVSQHPENRNSACKNHKKMVGDLKASPAWLDRANIRKMLQQPVIKHDGLRRKPSSDQTM